MAVCSVTYQIYLIFTVNCIWGAWSAWETCSVTCGGGNQERNRAISQQALFGGNECAGIAKETQSCNSQGCPGRYYARKYWWCNIKQ